MKKKEYTYLNSSPSIRKFSVENLGCAKNQVDAEQMITVLESQGWEWVKDHAESSVIILNTCGFIEPAKREAVDVFFELRKAYPDKKILVSGCFAQRYGEDLIKVLPEADGFFGNKDLNQVPSVATDVLEGRHPALFPVKVSKEFPFRTESLSFKGSTFVKIAEGCNNCCAFCAIPLIRGPLVSRDPDEILDEVKKLIKSGVFEINLIAQDLSSYGLDLESVDLPLLLRKITALEGDFWIRLLYIYPDRFPLEILDIMQKDPRILPYFDLPFQHASPKILKKMGRKGNPEIYLDLIRTIREKCPNAVIRSTFLVGFPGETSRDLAILLDFQQKAQIDWLGVFPYSREEDTPAYPWRSALSSKLLDKTIKKRAKKIEEAQIPITEKRMALYKGREFRVLVEEKIEQEDLFFSRGPIHAPEVDGLVVLHGENYKPGDIVYVRIVKVNGLDFEAIPIVAQESGE